MSSKKSPAKKTSAKETEAKAPSSYVKKFGSSGNTGKPHETEQTAEPVATEATAEQTPTTSAEAQAQEAERHRRRCTGARRGRAADDLRGDDRRDVEEEAVDHARRPDAPRHA